MEKISVTKNNGIATVVIDNPPMNALGDQVRSELLEGAVQKVVEKRLPVTTFPIFTKNTYKKIALSSRMKLPHNTQERTIFL